MRYLFFFLFLLLFSCESTEEVIDPIDTEEQCEVLNPYGFFLVSFKNSIIIEYGVFTFINTPLKICDPDQLEFYYAKENEDFIKVETVESGQGIFTIENLESEKDYYFKMVSIHSELDTITSAVQSIRIVDVQPPQFEDDIGFGFEDFRLAPGENEFAYRSSSNDWYHSSMNGSKVGNKIVDDAFYAQWSPDTYGEIAFVRQTMVDIAPNLQGSTSKSLSVLNLESHTETVLHEVEHLYDFSSDVHYPEQYWILDFRYSLDGTAIYLMSNKDNGSTNSLEKAVFDNIWRLDLNSGDMEAVTDFLPQNFDMTYFVEDPKQMGNFYLLGGTHGEKVDQGGGTSVDRVDIYYFDSESNNLSQVYISEYQEKKISINPTGDYLTFTSDKTGREEIWSYNLGTEELQQMTNSVVYQSNSKWAYVNWISDSEFMVHVDHEGQSKFAVFRTQ